MLYFMILFTLAVALTAFFVNEHRFAGNHDLKVDTSSTLSKSTVGGDLQVLKNADVHGTLTVDGKTTLLGGHLNTVVLNDGGTTVLSAANSGATCIFNDIGASNFTLPAPEAGMRFTFIQTVSNNGNHVIQSGTDGHGFIGSVMMISTTPGETAAHIAAVTGFNDFITIDGGWGPSPAGSRIEVVALSGTSAPGVWAVSGTIIAPVGALLNTPFDNN